MQLAVVVGEIYASAGALCFNSLCFACSAMFFPLVVLVSLFFQWQTVFPRLCTIPHIHSDSSNNLYPGVLILMLFLWLMLTVTLSLINSETSSEKKSSWKCIESVIDSRFYCNKL